MVNNLRIFYLDRKLQLNMKKVFKDAMLAMQEHSKEMDTSLFSGIVAAKIKVRGVRHASKGIIPAEPDKAVAHQIETSKSYIKVKGQYYETKTSKGIELIHPFSFDLKRIAGREDGWDIGVKDNEQRIVASYVMGQAVEKLKIPELVNLSKLAAVQQKYIFASALGLLQLEAEGGDIENAKFIPQYTKADKTEILKYSNIAAALAPAQIRLDDTIKNAAKALRPVFEIVEPLGKRSSSEDLIINTSKDEITHVAAKSPLNAEDIKTTLKNLNGLTNDEISGILASRSQSECQKLLLKIIGGEGD